jgi:hypothetical protein
MARVRNIAAEELPADLAAIYREFAGSYGPFANQVAVFAHVPAALRHLMPLLMELRAAKTLPSYSAKDAQARPTGQAAGPFGPWGQAAQRSRSLGSRTSHSASPNRLMPNTVSMIARPGKTAIQGAVEAYSSAPPCSISPQAGTGSCTPSPR